MDRISEFLNKRLAGIPAWLWGVIIGGSIALYAYLTRGEEVGVAPATVPFVDEFAPADAGDISGIPEVIDNENGIPIETNPAWIRFATDRLVADGEDPVLVNNALTKVLGGLEVTKQEAAMWGLAVRRFGPPPEGAPPIKVKGGSSPPPKGEPKPKPKVTKPARPTGLRASQVTRTSITLQWSPAARAVVYEINQKRARFADTVTDSQTAVRWKSLTPGKTYRYRVRAKNSAGYSPWSRTIRVTTRR